MSLSALLGQLNEITYVKNLAPYLAYEPNIILQATKWEVGDKGSKLGMDRINILLGLVYRALLAS